VIGVITGSMTIIASAVDSGGDLMVSVVNLFVVRLADREADEDHNYGHAKVEGLGAMFEGGFIFSAGCFLIYEAIHKAISPPRMWRKRMGIEPTMPLLSQSIIGFEVNCRRTSAGLPRRPILSVLVEKPVLGCL
jgi:cation diffusion facilitator family transporter